MCHGNLTNLPCVYCVRPEDPLKPTWFKWIKKLFDSLQEYLGLFNIVSPTITTCQPKSNQTKYKQKRTVDEHTREIEAVITFKANGNKDILHQLQDSLIHNMENRVFQMYNFGKKMSARNTNVLQDVLKVSDLRWREFTKLLHGWMGWPLFASRRQVDKLRKITKPRTSAVVEMTLSREGGGNQYTLVGLSKYYVGVVQENEVIAQAFDNSINNNEWIWYDSKHHGQVWCQIGGDKATKGGYNESVCLANDKFSVTKSMSTMYISGMSNLVYLYFKVSVG